MKKSIWIAGISAIGIVAIVLTVVFRKSLFKTSDKDHASAQNSHEPLNDAGFPVYYRGLLKEMFCYADSLGINDDINRVDLLQTYDSLVSMPGVNANGIRTASGLFFANRSKQFLFKAAYGDTLDIIYSGVELVVDSQHILNIAAQLALTGNWKQALDSVEPTSIQYLTLKSTLSRMNAFVKNYPDIDSVDTASASALRSHTILKLKAYDLIKNNPEGDSINDRALVATLCRFQKMMRVDSSGKSDKATIAMLRFPLSKRTTQIKKSLNFWRWSNRLAKQPFVFVNVAAAGLCVISDPSVKISMRVIPGEPKDKTPLFTAYFTKVTTYPYWVGRIGICVFTSKLIMEKRRLAQ